MDGLFDNLELEESYTPAKHFGLSIIGHATTPPIAGLPEGNYEVLRVIELLPPAGKSFLTNTWLYEYLREPLYVTELLGAVFVPLNNSPTLLRRRAK